MQFPGGQLATLLALLASLDTTGQARITQSELCDLLGTGPGRVCQSLQALVAAGVVEPPTSRRGYARRTPYGVPRSLGIAVDAPPYLVVGAPAERA